MFYHPAITADNKENTVTEATRAIAVIRIPHPGPPAYVIVVPETGCPVWELSTIAGFESLSLLSGTIRVLYLEPGLTEAQIAAAEKAIERIVNPALPANALATVPGQALVHIEALGRLFEGSAAITLVPVKLNGRVTIIAIETSLEGGSVLLAALA